VGKIAKKMLYLKIGYSVFLPENQNGAVDHQLGSSRKNGALPPGCFFACALSRAWNEGFAFWISKVKRRKQAFRSQEYKCNQAAIF
jgi:hypothetical protein